MSTMGNDPKYLRAETLNIQDIFKAGIGDDTKK